jgi:hypothetical protein
MHLITYLCLVLKGKNDRFCNITLLRITPGKLINSFVTEHTYLVTSLLATGWVKVEAREFGTTSGRSWEKLSTHLYLVLTLIMRGVVNPLLHRYSWISAT